MNHSHRLLISWFKRVSILVTYLCWKARQESSTYSNSSGETAYFIPLTYIRKSKGEESILEAHNTEFFRCLSTYFQCLLRMPEWNQLTVWSQKSVTFNFSNSILWSIVWNAFWRSISVVPVNRPLSNHFKILWFRYEKHKSVECFIRQPD